jgi:regulator of replication initiation timing
VKKETVEDVKRLHAHQMETMQAFADEVTRQLNAEINTNAALRAEIAQLQRDMSNMMGRA